LTVALLAIGLAAPAATRAQTDGLQQINDPVHHFLQRHKTLGHLPGAFVSHQPLSVYEAQGHLDSLAALGDTLAPGERERLARLRGEAPEPGAEWLNRQWGLLYRNGQDMASVAGDGYRLQLNPLLYTTVGRARRSGRPDVTAWRNTRGVRASGQIGPLFFESRLTENQQRPATVEFQGATAPRLGQSLIQGKDTYDYLTATGVVGFRSEFFEVRFGRQRNRWGYGAGSLLLSNYAPVYDQLQIRTSVWDLQYTNVFARFIQPDRVQTDERGGNTAFPRRYGAFHRLTWEVSDRFQLQLHESVVLATQNDSTVSRTGFDLSYLNPIIFYRAVERDLGSPDNAMIGIGGSWIATPGIRLYGQFLLDELIVSRIGNTSWANKWGWLAGADLARTGIPHLSAQVELTRQRPFLYAHYFPPNAFLHYNDPLGHPAPTNSWDLAAFFDYRPPGRLQAELNAAVTWWGRNPEGENVGADPRISTQTRTRDFVALLDGVRQTQVLLEGHLGIELLPDFFVEGQLQATVTDDAVRGSSQVVTPAVALRWGMPFASERY
jgi:hypothetical protein